MIRQRSILYNFFMSWTIEQMLIMLLFWWILNCVSQKKDFIQYPRFIKLIIADLIKKFPSIPLRLEEDYHSVKDEISLVVEGERYKESYADKFAASMLHDDVDDSGDRIKPGSHKEHLKFVDDDIRRKEEKRKIMR
ncbi:hypothetical protein Tco_0410709 [Tanacetum coccineum]